MTATRHDRLLDNIESLAGNETFEITVTGYSMLPMLGRGLDTVVVRPCSHEELVAGRIVMFRGENRHLIVHRIKRRDGDRFIMAGDGNYRKTELCNIGDIVGIVDKVIRRNGKIVDCTSRSWRLRERLWLATPAICRRYITAVMRRCLNRIKRNNR